MIKNRAFQQEERLANYHPSSHSTQLDNDVVTTADEDIHPSSLMHKIRKSNLV
jgi:hypothetical protein